MTRDWLYALLLMLVLSIEWACADGHPECKPGEMIVYDGEQYRCVPRDQEPPR